MSHATYMNESESQPYCLVPVGKEEERMSHSLDINESRLRYESVTSQISMRHTSDMKESCHIVGKAEERARERTSMCVSCNIF